MDPDVCWANIVDLARRTQAGRSDLAEAVNDLHEWLDKGGFPPIAWRRTFLDRSQITPGCAQHLLGVVEPSAPNALQAGSFITALLDAMLKADQTHLSMLAASFPGYAAAVNTFHNDLDGRRYLITKAAER